jgi:CoA:oxalate CoA-transferase
MRLPLNDITVLEFSQYMSGSVSGLRLADLGARVYRIEIIPEGKGDHSIDIGNSRLDKDLLSYHAINRNKEHYLLNLHDSEDRELINKLIEKADVLVDNMRSELMKRYGLDHETLLAENQSLVYAKITGYGSQGPWKNKQSQDLLVQAVSGLTYTTGNSVDNPMEFSLPIAEYTCGNQAVQAILAALIRRNKTGKGAFVELSLLESLLDLQFEFLTTYFASGELPDRSLSNSGHALLGAPYGLYETKNGYLALAMIPLTKLNKVLCNEELESFTQEESFSRRDEIKKLVAGSLKEKDSEYWLEKFRALDLWVMPVLNWKELSDSDVYRKMNWEQTVQNHDLKIVTGRCPIKINGKHLTTAKALTAFKDQDINLEKGIQ